jgi:hypothetical protein
MARVIDQVRPRERRIQVDNRLGSETTSLRKHNEREDDRQSSCPATIYPGADGNYKTGGDRQCVPTAPAGPFELLA